MEPTTEIKVGTVVFDIPDSKMNLVNLLLHEVCVGAQNEPEEKRRRKNVKVHKQS